MSLTAQTSLGTARALTAPRTLIHSEAFDAFLLCAPMMAALASLAIVTSDPRLYSLILLADLWLLGYHHVVATYTRLAFDTHSLRQNRFLAVDLLVLVMAATMALALTAGAWFVTSAFLYLQWFHYMRQGYGIGRMFFRSTPQGQGRQARDLAADLVVYLVPIYCIARRSATLGSVFLDRPVKAIVLPEIVITILGAAAAMATAVWIVQIVRSALNGKLDAHYTGYIASHVAIFLVGYVLVDNANTGWLAINIWHNFQYVMVVWMVNSKRYARGVDPAAPLLSRISQPGRAFAYFGTCLLISTVVYLGLDGLTAIVFGGGLALTLGVYMGINFHHYIVDALIWKRRKPAAAVA